MKTYTFKRRTVNLPEGVEQKMTFFADCLISALQLASDYWFNGSRIVDYHRSDDVLTLLGTAGPGEGNVVGTVIYC